MPKINVLPAHVADLIAAGEVVERPASVIKELIENSIDAGASALTVEIKDGGMSYIRVTDNGCGMAAEDAETAFLRHATSKLKDERDLEAIGTLGFRGEALAAIAAVSRVELLTRPRGAEEGLSLCLEGGRVTGRAPAGCPEGTTIIVRDLFFNTPARLKFMKSDRAEGQAAGAAVVRCALSHTEVSIRYIKDGEEEAHTPGDGEIDSAVYSVLGRDFARDLLPVSSEKVKGLIAPPSAARGNRGFQFFFVNGRFVKSKTMQAALEQAFKNNLPNGRFPACVLYLTLPNAAVDVNVHPTKTEVKFLDERGVFDCVYYAVSATLEDVGEPPELSLGGNKTASYAPRPEAFRSMSAEEFRRTGGALKPAIPHVKTESEPILAMREAPVIAYQTKIPDMPHPVSADSRKEHEGEGPNLRIIGEAMGTYIIAEAGDELFLIDKHAAHERIIFDRLRENTAEPMSEFLLTPAPVRLGELAAAVLENAELLTELGFEIEDFGDGAVLVRATPSDCDVRDVAPMIEELAQMLSGRKSAGQYGLRDSILQSVACKAAIKAGRESDRRELEALAARVVKGEIKYCPHGRPVAVTLAKKELDKQFKRI